MARTLPFHEAGIRFTSDEPIGPAEAVEEAGLDFQVSLAPIYHQPAASFEKIGEWQATRRDDTGRVLGIVKGTYVPIQNRDAFSFLNVVTDSGEALIDSGGSLRYGALNWLYARVPENVVLANDNDEQITVGFMVSNGHDGKRALRATPILLRVSTMTVLSGRALGQSFGLRHAGSMEGKVKEARQALGVTFRSLARLDELAARLVRNSFSRSAVDSMLSYLYPAEDESNVHPKVQERRDTVMAILYGSPTLEAHRSDGQVTGWAFYMAVCEYADYFAPYRDSFRASAAENRLLSVTAGDAWKMKDKALAMVLGE